MTLSFLISTIPIHRLSPIRGLGPRALQKCQASLQDALVCIRSCQKIEAQEAARNQTFKNADTKQHAWKSSNIVIAEYCGTTPYQSRAHVKHKER